MNGEKGQNIKSTIDYKIFNLIDGNRKINKSHISSLKKSILENNLLHLRPILIDKNNNILDGQHRFHAAQELELPLYYIQCDSENYKEIISLNQNQKNWKLINFVEFFSKTFQNEHYKKILFYLNEYKIPLEVFFIYIDYNVKKHKIRDDFEKGNFIFKYDEDKIKTHISNWICFHECITQCFKEFSVMLNQLYFRKALYYFLNSNKINESTFWQKTKDNLVVFYKCYNFDQCIELLLKLYNSNSPIKIEKGHLFL